MIKGDGRATDSFCTSFGALELIAGGYLSEARIKDLEIRKLGEVVASVKKQRDAAIAELPSNRIIGKGIGGTAVKSKEHDNGPPAFCTPL
jgi:hypothetical protein